ncbi:MAG: hypothetical protein ACR2KJ_14055 [Jatrophihabitans sp.]
MNEWSDPVFYGRADEVLTAAAIAEQVVAISVAGEFVQGRGRHLRRAVRAATSPRVSRVARSAGGRRGRSAWSSSLRTGELGPNRIADQQSARKRRPAA